MSDTKNSDNENKDSFQVPLKKSPLFLFAMIQIPLVIFMVIMLYVVYQNRS